MNGKFQYRRKSIRLPGYDYSKAGFYFVTICAKNKECLFGEVANKKMYANEFGKIVIDEWFKTPCIRKNIALDAFVLMPNHIHGIIIIKYKIKSRTGVLQYAHTPDAHTPDARTGVLQYAHTLDAHTLDAHTLETFKKLNNKSYLRSSSGSLGAIIRGFKGAATARINKNRKDFDRSPVWHRNYYERVIRSPKELNSIRQYINNNPKNWRFDKENPINI